MSEYYVHPSSVVDEGVTIGEGTRIWHFCHIQKGALIGRHCSLGQNVNVSNNVTIGDGCKLQNNVSVYEGVELEDYVFCGPSCVFTNDLTPRAKYPKGAAGYKKTLIREGASIGAKVTVVDAGKCRMYMRNFGEFFNDQIEHAGTIVLSHTAGLSEEKLTECVALLREHNPDAVIVTTDWNELSGAQLLAAMERKDTLAAELEKLAKEEEVCPVCGHHHHHHDEDDDDDEDEHDHHHDDDDDDDEDEHEHHHHHHEDGEECHCHDHDHDHEGHHHHHHHADEIFVSCGAETAKRFDKAALAVALAELTDTEKYGMVLRAKGIVEGTDGKFIHFDYVPGEPDVRNGSAAVTGRLCVIGSGLHIDALSALFGVELQ